MINLKISRIKKGLSQKQLAEILGMSPSTICRIETGKKEVSDLKVSTLNKIANTLDVPLNELLECN